MSTHSLRLSISNQPTTGLGACCVMRALNIRRQNCGVKYFGGRTNEIRDQFSLSVKNAARADGKRHHPTATLFETFVNRGRSCWDRQFFWYLPFPTAISQFLTWQIAHCRFVLAFPRHFFPNQKVSGFWWDCVAIQDRLRDHAKAFDGLLSLIPAKYYYGEDNSVCQILRKLSRNP